MKRPSENISNTLPCNIDAKHIALYKAKSQYDCPQLQVREYTNVFVSHEGLCWRNFRLLPYSTFNINSSYDAKHCWEFFRLVTEQYLVSTFGKSLKKITLPENEKYALIHTKWFNYSFWLTSSLVRLRMLLAKHSAFTLIYPEEWDTISYIQDTLKAFPNIKKEKIPAGVHVQVPHLLLPEVRPFTACLNESDIKDVATQLLLFYKDQITGIGDTPQKLFVNRKKASCRKMANEQVVANLLKQRGFVEIDFDDLSIVEQMAYMQNAKNVVMMHGAGMVNVMFARPQTKILELMHEYTKPQTYRFIYWFLTVQMQCDYYVQFCKTIDNHSDEWRKDIEVDSALLEQNLNFMLQEYE